MERILLFDGSCAACSSLARVVADLGLPTLGTRALHDPDIARRLDRSGLKVPDGPALLLDDGRNVRLLTGIRLRLHLMRLLGLRRGREIAQLAVAESKARRQHAAAGGAVSRRGMLRGVLGLSAGAVGGTVLGASQPASANRPSKLSTAPADPQLVNELLMDAKVQRAITSFGPASANAALEVVGADEPIAAITHRSGVTTFVGMAAGKDRVVLAMQPLGTGRGIEFLSPAGDLICTVSQAGGRVEAHAPSDVEPDSFTTCMAFCLGLEIGADCLDSCSCCIDCPWPAYYVGCTACALCAGSKGVTCARRCL